MSLNDSDALFDNTTVTAGWNAKTYTVTINPNGASGSSKTYNVSYGQRWQVPSCPFSRTGYNFNGYSGGYSAGQTITITGNITMSCIWSVKYYTVSIYPNGASGSAKTYRVAYGNSFTFPSCPFTRSGYNFKGYATSSSGSASYQAKGTVSNITSNKSYYCVWANALAGKSISLTVDAHYQSNSNSNYYILQCSTISPELYGQVLCVKLTNFSGVQQDVIRSISLGPNFSLNETLQTVQIGRTSGSNLVRRGYLYFWFNSKGERTAVSLEVDLNERDTPIKLTY